jgi:hypothetical protein
MMWLRFAGSLALAGCIVAIATVGAAANGLWLAILALGVVVQARALYRRYRDG